MAELAGTAKHAYVRRMFARIAGRYDLLNSLFTLGQDKWWRHTAVSLLGIPSHGLVLDVACGTGEITLDVVKRGGHAVGVDFSPHMMSLGQTKMRKQGHEDGIHFVLGDALALPFRDGSFAGSITGFSLRNVVSVERLMAEMWRVVVSGGRLVCLELAHPKETWLSKPLKWYFDHVIPVLGRVLSGDKEAYTYLPRSLDAFPESAELVRTMEQAGWRQVSYRTLNSGLVALHTGLKE